MNVTREQVSVALFNLIQAGLQAQSVVTFNTISRRGQIWTNVPPAMQPAAFLIEVNSKTDQPTRGYGVSRYNLEYRLLIYCRADTNPTAIMETQLNNLLDAIDYVVNPTPGIPQTLGTRPGTNIPLVVNAWIEGTTEMDTGILDQQCALVIPIVVQTGN